MAAFEQEDEGEAGESPKASRSQSSVSTRGAQSKTSTGSSIFDKIGYRDADREARASAERVAARRTTRIVSHKSTLVGATRGPASVPPEATAEGSQQSPPPVSERPVLGSGRAWRAEYSEAPDRIEHVVIPRPPRLPTWSGMEAPGATGAERPSRHDEETSGAGSTRWPEVLVPKPLQSVGQDWLKTGVLRLTPTTSGRHARALQRAILLYLLMEHGYSALPDGLRRRAAWLFRIGWADGAGVADGDDLCFVLGLQPGGDERLLLTRTAQIRIPRDDLLTPSSYPASRRFGRT